MSIYVVNFNRSKRNIFEYIIYYIAICYLLFVICYFNIT
ncbi:putative membrane protein [Escherichia coli EC4422]